MGAFKWIKKHPWESAAIAAALVGTGGMAAGAFGAGAAGAGVLSGEAALGAGAVAGDAFLPAALGAGGAGGLTPAAIAAGGGEAVSGLAGGSALLGGEDFAAQMAGSTIAGGMPESALLSGLPPMTEYGLGGGASGLTGQYASAGGAEGSLYDPSQLADPKTAMGPRESTWLSRMSPKSVMTLGMMAAQMGSRPPGGPAPMAGPPQTRQALMSQEEITKKWLLHNDPNTYRRIYGNPQGVA